MRFDGNRAWGEAMAMVSANRELLMVLAGVFFLLPALVMAFFFGDLQMQMLANLSRNMANPRDPAIAAAMAGVMAKVAPVALLVGIAQMVGHMAMMALITDPRRPTVAEALTKALACLPTIVAALVLFIVGYLVFALGFGLVLGLLIGLGMLLGTAVSALFTVVGFVALVAVVVLIMSRLSLTMPVVVVDGQRNPWTALRQSWTLVSGNSRRLALFYFLLGLAYMVIAVVLMIVIGTLVALVAGKGSGLGIVTGLFQGVIAGAAAMVFTAIIAAVHRQLSGVSPATVGAIFE